MFYATNNRSITGVDILINWSKATVFKKNVQFKEMNLQHFVAINI